jgi:hypothetical protein
VYVTHKGEKAANYMPGDGVIIKKRYRSGDRRRFAAQHYNCTHVHFGMPPAGVIRATQHWWHGLVWTKKTLRYRPPRSEDFQSWEACFDATDG